MNKFEERVRKEFKFLSWAPIVFISALERKRLDKLIDKVMEVKANLSKRVKTSVINDVLIDAQMMQPAPSHNGGRLQITFGKQIEAKIPTFTLFCNDKKYLHFSYERFLENQFRQYFGFEGTPIRLLFRNKKKVEYNEK